MHGSVTPRLWTPPLRELTPATSYGYDVVEFADTVLGVPLDAWQRWVVIHAGELLPDGRPRFRVVLIIVARQNGKTWLSKVLTLFWLFVDRVGLVLSTSTARGYAKESWSDCIAIAEANPYLAPHMAKPRLTIGEETMNTRHGSRYMIAAANRRAGRSLSIDRLIIDELREHSTWDAWAAAVNAMNARPYGQVVAISNQGDDQAVVLNSLRASALAYLETGAGDDRLGLLEYSAPDGCDPVDLANLAMANPNLYDRIDPDALVGAARRAVAAGGEELTMFRTEVLCQRVDLLDPAIDPGAWAACGVDDPVDLAEHRDRVALAYDVSLDGQHATLAAAAVVDGRVRVELVQAWDGTAAMRRELPAIVERIRPRVLAWLPNGPAAAVAAALADRKTRGWPPRRVVVEDIKGDVTAVCMGLAELVHAGELDHPRDPLLNAHVAAAQRLRRGDAWAFQRRGSGPIDALYAAAAAVHCARTLPPPPPALVIL